jgi:hypothetical protein
MRIAIRLDDELSQRLFAEHVGRAHHVESPPDGAELRRLALAGALDVAVVGVSSRDVFWPAILGEISKAAPAMALVGVIDMLRPSLHEAAALARDISDMGFVSAPDARFDHLARRRVPGSKPPTFTGTLLDCISSLPLAGVGHDFALLQALRPSLTFDIPEQAALLSAGRRKLERWFQGPDICSARRLQSVCAAAEAMYLRLAHGARDREIAGAIGLLGVDGDPSPVGVPREIRAAFGDNREAIRAGGVAALETAVNLELRRPQHGSHAPARWEPSTRYWPTERVLAVPIDGRLVLVDPDRGVSHAIDDLGADAWELMARGSVFSDLAAALVKRRGEPPVRIREWLKQWLGELLVLGLVRRSIGNEAETNTSEGV